MACPAHRGALFSTNGRRIPLIAARSRKSGSSRWVESASSAVQQLGRIAQRMPWCWPCGLSRDAWNDEHITFHPYPDTSLRRGARIPLKTSSRPSLRSPRSNARIHPQSRPPPSLALPHQHPLPGQPQLHLHQRHACLFVEFLSGFGRGGLGRQARATRGSTVQGWRRRASRRHQSRMPGQKSGDSPRNRCPLDSSTVRPAHRDPNLPT